MAKEYVSFSGKAKWNRLIQPDLKFGKWNIVVYFDDVSLEKFRDLQASKGLKNVMKKDDDGYNLTFSRPVQKMMKGVMVGFEPPKVIDKDNQVIHQDVGHGSDVTVICEMYTYTDPYKKKGHALRLESVRVDNLVEYNAMTDPESQLEREAAKRAAEAPEPLW